MVEGGCCDDNHKVGKCCACMIDDQNQAALSDVDQVGAPSWL